jgi:MSHA biogenesis protein MshM
MRPEGAVISNYLEFFGLSQSPFEPKTLRPLVLETGPLRRAISFARVEIDSGTPIAVISGASGIGKTSVALALPHVLQERTAIVLDPTQGWEALQASISEQLGLEKGIFSVETLVAARREHGQRIVLVIDDAGKLCDEALEHIEPMLGVSVDVEDGKPLVPMVVISNFDPRAAQSSGPNASWILRTWPKIELAGMLARELEQYVEARLSNAGWSGGLIFSPEALQTVNTISGGIPRLANVVCERSLVEAARRGVAQIDEQLVAATDPDEATEPILKVGSARSRRKADAKAKIKVKPAKSAAPAPTGPPAIPESPASVPCPEALAPEAAEPVTAAEIVGSEKGLGPIQACSNGLARLTAPVLEHAAKLRKRGLQMKLVLPAVSVLGLALIVAIDLIRTHEEVEEPGISDVTVMERQAPHLGAAVALVAQPDAEPAAVDFPPAENLLQQEAADTPDSALSTVRLAQPSEPSAGVPEVAPSSAVIVASRMGPAVEAIDSPGPAKPTFAGPPQLDAPVTREPVQVPAEPVAPTGFKIPGVSDLGQGVGMDSGAAPDFAPSLDFGQPELNRDLKPGAVTTPRVSGE